VDERFQPNIDLTRTERGALPADVPRPPAASLPNIEPALASIALGAVFALMAFPTMLMIHVLADNNFRGWDRVAVGVAALAGSIGGLIALTSTAFGLIFGIMGMNAARRQARSTALGFAGVLLNGLDVWMWIGILVAWIAAVHGRH
jgi:hypothetical protein